MVIYSKKYSENEHILSLEEYTFLLTTVTNFRFQPIEAERLLYIATEIWPERQTFFGTNIGYEVIILGIALKVSKEFIRIANTTAEKLDYFIKMYYPDNAKKNLISVYRACEIVEDIIDGKNL